jgi:hypothetical protein
LDYEVIQNNWIQFDGWKGERAENTAGWTFFKNEIWVMVNNGKFKYIWKVVFMLYQLAWRQAGKKCRIVKY